MNNKVLIYENSLSKETDIQNFVLEGKARIQFVDGRMRLISTENPARKQKANYVLWCKENFPSNIEITWDFYPLQDEGLCMLFFAAKGENGKDIFDESLNVRTGEYQQYYDGDINAFHVSYFRRKAKSERAFRTCNLRKSKGFHLVMQGADPIPNIDDCMAPYKIKVVKLENKICFYINELRLFEFIDDRKTYGDLLEGGKIGFRQMSPMIAEYANLKVYHIKGEEHETNL